MSTTTLYILPVSGEFFCYQLGQICLIDSIFKPDVCFASSGGNIVSYISHANDWKEERILNSLELFDNESFLTSWFDFIPLWISLSFTKSLFPQGYGFNSFFKKYYSGNRAKEGAEIISGVVEDKHHKLFSNKKDITESIIKPRILGVNATGPCLGEASESIVYLNGNIEEISRIVRSSASIPFLVENLDIYGDGGGMFSSPGSLFSDEIVKFGKTNKIRLIFFSCNNVDILPHSSVDLIKEFQNIINGLCLQEIRIFINTISSFDGIDARNPKKYTNLSKKQFKDLIAELDATNKNYGILLFPSEDFKPTISLMEKFHSSNLKFDVLTSRKNTSAYVWSV